MQFLFPLNILHKGHNPRVAPERCLKDADLHDMGKQDVSFVAVWLNYRFQGQQIPQLEEDD
jgi:hypothetical protein